MTRAPSDDFDVDALYAALNAKRQSHGLSWQQVAREISGLFGRVPARPISASTLTGMRSRQAVDGDGVLQMLRWLGRTPEHFIFGCNTVAMDGDTLPAIGTDRILRFDAIAIYSALNAQRLERGMAWQDVANEIGGCNPASLTRLAKGGRVGFPGVMRILRWLGRPAASFTRASPR